MVLFGGILRDENKEVLLSGIAENRGGGMKDSSELDASADSEAVDHILAHDLTNYLNIIRGHADLLLADVDDADIADHLHTIKGQTIAATAMLQTIGGGVRGDTQSEVDGVAVADLLSIETDRLRSAYPGASIEVNVTEGLRVRADDLLMSVFANLIENAIIHNDSPDPRVRVTATDMGRMARILVEDNGPGLPADVEDQLEGTGLAPPQSGIYIIRFLVEQYDGSISVQTGPAGTTITLEFPTPEPNVLNEQR